MRLAIQPVPDVSLFRSATELEELRPIRVGYETRSNNYLALFTQVGKFLYPSPLVQS
jgi:hypothetical protein